jgi:CubicO group peptidase (beta-lactamase class C family)
VRLETHFDLASLSKPLAPTLLLFDCMEQGLLTAETRYASLCCRPVPEEKREITIGQLLSHSSGLPAYHPYYTNFAPVPDPASRDRILAAIEHEPLGYQPGNTCLYSDLGFLLLGDLLEKVTKTTLDELFRKRIARPLGLEKEIFYVPLSGQSPCYSDNRFAATEECPWRNRVLQGEVHDEHCLLFGGVSGHAGLFATIRGVTALCKAILDTWQGLTTPLPVSPAFMTRALQPFVPGQTWCLGFDTPSPAGYTSAGQRLSRTSIGHLGYAGTSFWIDPDHSLIIVLLTNRVHPSRNNTKIREFRPWFHDRIMEYLFSTR